MSRTDKDRPYWVMSNDPSERFSAWHNCGAQRGVVGYGMRTVRRQVEFQSDWFLAWDSESNKWTYSKAPRREWVDVEEYGPLYGPVYVPCDIDEPATGSWRRSDKNCFYTSEKFVFWYNETPSWWVRQTVRTPTRAKERRVLTDAIKWYRGDPESFEDDFDFGIDEVPLPYYH